MLTSALRSPAGRPSRAPATAPGPLDTPLFILAPHPGLVDVPETNLATAATLLEWRVRQGWGRALGTEGLLRAVAEFRFGDQTAGAVRAARWWIDRHLGLATDDMWSLLEDWVRSLPMVEKSPAVGYERVSLEWLIDRWPSARYVHLVRHPVSYSLSMLDMPAARRWMALQGAVDDSGGESCLDPKRLWLRAHATIVAALTRIPGDRRVRIRTENLLSDPRRVLTSIARHFRLPVDSGTADAMLHPERSPFAHLGPPGARFGNDPSFLQQPELRKPRSGGPPSLEDRLPWRRDGRRLSPEVAKLAGRLGYAESPGDVAGASA